MGGFDLAFANEALARAFAVSGDAQKARAATDRAILACDPNADEEDFVRVCADSETSAGPAPCLVRRSSEGGQTVRGWARTRLLLALAAIVCRI